MNYMHVHVHTLRTFTHMKYDKQLPVVNLMF